MSAILTSIQSLLSDPNPNSPANSMAAQLFKENRREYEKRVKACVEQSWCDDWYFPSKFGGSKTFSIKKSPTSKIRYDLILPTRVYYLGILISNTVYKYTTSRLILKLKYKIFKHCELLKYRTRATITLSWLENALEYLPYIRPELQEQSPLKDRHWTSKSG